MRLCRRVLSQHHLDAREREVRLRRAGLQRERSGEMAARGIRRETITFLR